MLHIPPFSCESNITPLSFPAEMINFFSISTLCPHISSTFLLSLFELFFPRSNDKTLVLSPGSSLSFFFLPPRCFPLSFQEVPLFFLSARFSPPDLLLTCVLFLLNGRLRIRATPRHHCEVGIDDLSTEWILVFSFSPRVPRSVLFAVRTPFPRVRREFRAYSANLSPNASLVPLVNDILEFSPPPTREFVLLTLFPRPFR